MKKHHLHLLLTTLSAAFERLSKRLTIWFVEGQDRHLPPEDDDGPALEEVLAQDGRTRLIILACLDGVEWADLRFISALIHQVGEEASEETQQRSLAWLLEQGCISERRKWLPRAFFWERRRQIVVYALTSVGATVLAQWRAAAHAASPHPSDKTASWWLVLSLIRAGVTLAFTILALVFGTMLLFSVIRP